MSALERAPDGPCKVKGHIARSQPIGPVGPNLCSDVGPSPSTVVVVTAALAYYSSWYWGGRGFIFILIAVISLVVRLVARSRRSSVSGRMMPQQFQQPYPQQPQQYPQQPYPQQPYPQGQFPQQQYPQPQQYPEQPYQQPPPPMPTSPFSGPNTNPIAPPTDPFASGPDHPRSTPL